MSNKLVANLCHICKKPAIIKSQVEIPTRFGNVKRIITYNCLHVKFEDSKGPSNFASLTFDGISTCNHKWGKERNRTKCELCDAKRLYEYQIEGAKKLEEANGKLAIFDEMGLGKTIQALAYLKFHPEVRPFLWITKAGIKFQHGKEIIRLLGKENLPQVITTGRDILIPGMNVVASYSIFRRLDREMFIEHGFKSVILDECQAIKNPDSSQTGEVRQIVRNIPSIIPLSGTPWKNRGSEFFVVLNMLDPARFNNYEGFKRVWVSSYYQGDKVKEGGIVNPEKFKEFIKHIAIRRERAEVLPELPLINRTKILCEVDKAARAIYQVEEKKLLALLDGMAIGGEDESSFENAAKIQQSIMIMRQIVGIAKVGTTVEFVEEFLEDTDRKIVVFVHHKKCGELIFNQLSTFCAENGYAQPLKITADMDSIERFATQENFNKANGPRVLVGSTLASGEGLNLQSCSDCVLHERQWNPANEEQAEGRFIRIGQTAQSVNAVYMHGDDTVDTIFDSIVESKRQAFHEVMNKGTLVSWNEGNILSELIEQIRNKKRNK